MSIEPGFTVLHVNKPPILPVVTVTRSGSQSTLTPSIMNDEVIVELAPSREKVEQVSGDTSSGGSGSSSEGEPGSPDFMERPTLSRHFSTENEPSRSRSASVSSSTSSLSLSDSAEAAADYSNWVSDGPVHLASGLSSYTHLPDPTSAYEWEGLSSYPNTQEEVSVQAKELEYSLKRLLSPTVFESFLQDSRGRKNFRSYLTSKFGQLAVSALDLYWDLTLLEQLNWKAKAVALGIRDVYLDMDSPSPVALPSSAVSETHTSMRSIAAVTGLGKTTQHLLESLYSNEFQSYVKHRLVQSASVQLGLYDLTPEQKSGLGECFCLTNPRMPDCPIVLCSDAFCLITGYKAEQIIGRNCRFLQGNATAPTSVTAIHTALAIEEGCTQLLLNYRADGTPFWNLLTIIPLKDPAGNVTYFIGGQTNVTGTMAAGSHLSFLVGSDILDSANESTTSFSAAVQASAKSPDGGMRSDLALQFAQRRESLPPTPYAPLLSPQLVSGPFDDQPKTIWNKLFSPKEKELKALPTPPVEELSEIQFSRASAPLADRVVEFTTTYQKLLMFRKKDRRVLFVTKPFLQHVGLPTSTPAEVNASPLLNVDILELVVFKSSKEKSEHLPKLVQAIALAKPVSIPCGIRRRREKRFAKTDLSQIQWGALHATPLYDAKPETVAFVLVFG